MEGLLCKWRGGTWQHRWLVLNKERRLLTFYASKMKNGPQRGSIRLSQARVAVVHDDQLSFTVHSHTKKILLKAESVGEKEQWVVALLDCTSSDLQEDGDAYQAAGEEKDSDTDSDHSDEEFYDANDGTVPRITTTTIGQPMVSELASSVAEEDDYIERDDTSNGFGQNKSVVMHILSLARQGLDLTHMRLPAFILEKRSTLEMCSSFLSHPDIFAAVPNHATPKERMVAIVRFYCSTFHAARNMAAVKKPYNPILGETFHCFWDLPGAAKTPADKQTLGLLQSGPVPYANYDSVTFIAEQVSHHPPVSAFYAESLPLRMYLNGSVHTKIRFLGLSVGVYNTATVQLHILDYGEEYIMSMPNTYVRSILTYPWLELGGRSTISCPQTGYHATIDFHCKPFYGGKKHQMTCEISHKSEKRPFHKIEGEWNGVMYTKHSKESREVFIDTINTPTVRKKLLKLSAQGPGESRKRWQHVTEALYRGDVDAASRAKHVVEEEQRADAKRRQELGIEWQQKLFHQEGNVWVFNSPLSSRLAQLKQTSLQQTS